MSEKKSKMKRGNHGLNLVGENDADVKLQHHQQVILDMVTGGKTETLWKEALANTQFLEGKEVQVANGQMVDFSHFDLIIASTQFLPEDMTSDMKMMKAFWVTLYPFIKRLKNYAHHFQAKYRELAYDQDKTLKNYANQNLELKIYREFMEKNLANSPVQEQFKHFFKKRKAESDAQVAEMAKQEEKRQKKHKAKLEKIDEKNRQTTLGHNLKHHITAKDGLNLKQ